MTTSDRHAIINDRYELTRRIGRGGMADVFLGRDRLLDRQVAIKVLFPEFATDPNFVERFRREAQAAANLSHPNIVNVYDWGRHSGTYYICMEYVQGRTLGEILRTNGHVTSKQAAEIASEVAAALGFAHEAGLVHRDVKPANILIGSNGQVKVADFGIARAMNAPTESNLTQAGAVMGTATYFSPEQAQGAQPDPRSDLYSLGIVMYEMVAGRPPFTGDNPVSIAYKQVHDNPQPLNQLVVDIPRPYEAIVAKLLAKDPKVRYASANALRDDLRRFRNGDQVLALAAAAASAARGSTVASSSTAPTVLLGDAPPTVAQPTTADRLPTGASPEAPYYEPPPSRTGWYALAAFFALIALGIGGILLFQALSGDDDPSSFALDNYVGQPLDEVVADLTERGLQPVPEPEEDSRVPVGVVHRTDPVEGTVVVEGAEIRVFFNPEPELQEVPNVEGELLADARRTLAAAGFRTNPPTTEQSDEIEEGRVIRTEPPAGTQVRQDTRINIVVSGGPEQFAVPSGLVGRPEDEARQILQGDPFGFDVTTVREPSESIQEGLVIRTEPGEGALVARGGEVVLVVSDGPPGVTVPNVIGSTEESAREQLSQFNVSDDVRDLPAGDPNDGLVVAQSLDPGSVAPAGTNITIVIGRAAEPPPPETTPAPTTTRAPTTTQAPTTTRAPTTTQPRRTTTSPPPTTVP